MSVEAPRHGTPISYPANKRATPPLGDLAVGLDQPRTSFEIGRYSTSTRTKNKNRKQEQETRTAADRQPEKREHPTEQPSRHCTQQNPAACVLICA